jgi:hypothetical protein
MSDNILKIIPVSPIYLPTEELIQKALTSIKLFFLTADKIINKNTPGTNLGRIICPQCGKEINETWWKEAMDKAYQKEFLDLNIIVPCCNSKVSLNKLKYEQPAGFAQFSIQIVNPNRDLTDEELYSIATILNTKLRKIWAHY